MRRIFLATLISVSVAALVALFGNTANAQEAGTERAAKNAEGQPRQENIYRLDYALQELENGKRTNSRTYSLMAATPVWPASSAGFGGYQGFHVGSRIPMSTGKDQIQYFDLGVKINSRLKERENNVLIETSLDMNSAADSAPSGAASSALGTGQGPMPVIRSLNLSSVTQAVPGKPALVGSIDDVTGNRRYEIEVTAIKVK
jgi:hypothetical protein